MTDKLLTFLLLLWQGACAAWRDACEDLMVDECEATGDNLITLIAAPYVSNVLIVHRWQRFMAGHRSDPMFGSVTGRIIEAFLKHRPVLMEDCIPSEPPPVLGDADDDYEDEGQLSPE